MGIFCDILQPLYLYLRLTIKKLTMTPRIQRAIDTFLDAINEGTLAKGSCAACAVGNLVAKGINYKIISLDVIDNDGNVKPNTRWSRAFATGGLFYPRYFQGIYRQVYIHDNKCKENIDSTEFTFDELAKIEYTFETNTKIFYVDYNDFTKEQVRQDQINGLAAVVKVMLEFDDCKDSVEEIFIKKAEAIPV